MRRELRRRDLVLPRPHTTAAGTVGTRTIVELLLHADDGLVGRGEAAPLPGYDSDSLDDVEAALASGRDDLPHARAAVDMALLDLEALRAGVPLCRLLADAPLDRVAVNGLVGAIDPAAAASEARELAAAGFATVKVKIGDDRGLGRVAAVREAVGPRIAIRVDANGAWSPPEAVRRLAELAPLGIELCEEPVHGVEALREVQSASAVPIAMDETLAEDGAAASGATALVCLKVGRAGGIRPALELARMARAAGSEVFVASALDGPAGIAASLHLAAALRVGRACGLATLGPPFAAEHGHITVPGGPGLL